MVATVVVNMCDETGIGVEKWWGRDGSRSGEGMEVDEGVEENRRAWVEARIYTPVGDVSPSVRNSTRACRSVV